MVSLLSGLDGNKDIFVGHILEGDQSIGFDEYLFSYFNNGAQI